MTDGIIADIGGTNARFALVEGGKVGGEKILKCADYGDPAEAVRAYIGSGRMPSRASFAIAGPVNGDDVTAVNSPWKFRISEIRKKLGFEYFSVMNDFKALALAVPHLTPKDFRQVGGGKAIPQMPIAVIGPGTGLGVGGLVWENGRYVGVAGEGGHTTMAAKTQREFDIFSALLEKYTHVSAERVCSGKGLVNLYDAMRLIDGRIDLGELPPEEISRRALARECDVCTECLDLMTGFLGTVAGNFALGFNAVGGVYIAGGIVPHLGDYFDNSRFRHEFESKGRMKDYMSAIPTFVIVNELSALAGLRADLLAA